jgi:hypothetical protein
LAFNMMQAAFTDGAFYISGDRARAVCDREAAARGHNLDADPLLAVAG